MLSERDAMVARAGEKPLYQVLEQQAAPVGNALMGSDHTYVIPGAGAAAAAGAPARGAAAAAAKRCGVPEHCALGCFCILILLPMLGDNQLLGRRVKPDARLLGDTQLLGR